MTILGDIALGAGLYLLLSFPLAVWAGRRLRDATRAAPATADEKEKP